MYSDWMSGSQNTPGEATTPLHDMAVQLHELFLSLQAAGFTETQALTLISGRLRGTSDTTGG